MTKNTNKIIPLNHKTRTRVNYEYFNPEFEYETIFPDLDWPWAGHKYFIYDFIRYLKPKTIVELGTHKRTSIFSMTQAVKDGNLKTKLLAVDTIYP